MAALVKVLTHYPATSVALEEVSWLPEVGRLFSGVA